MLDGQLVFCFSCSLFCFAWLFLAFSLSLSLALSRAILVIPATCSSVHKCCKRVWVCVCEF